MDMRRIITIIAAILLTVAAAALVFYTQARTTTVGEVRFDEPLPIPPLLSGAVDPGGGRTFHLRLQTGQMEFHPGVFTETWGANGPYLAPTLRMRRGEEVAIRIANELPEPTTIHWHGMRLPGAADGGPHQSIAPGSEWQAAWKIEQPAATLWYHPHPHGRTAEHVYRGISGLIIIDDDEAADLDLPAEYGVDDVPIVLRDKRFRRDGSLSLREGLFNIVGVLGDEVFVNGSRGPFFEASTTRVRLRLLNGSNSRLYNLGFDDDRGYQVIASDAGFLEAPVVLNRLQLSPGERAEIVVRLQPGERITLRSFPPRSGMPSPLARMNGGHDSFDLLEIRAAAQLVESHPLPARLVDIEPLDPGAASRRRSFELDTFSRINGREMAMDRVDFGVRSGEKELWVVRNPSINYHNFHVHLVHFQILEIDGVPPPPELAGWKDTVFLPPGSSAQLLSRFHAEPDVTAPFMFHCHLLEHEDDGMMGQFVVTD
jgi:FtsP/CotA-like multicopper oxidase with cupredoxin domain